MNKKSRKAAAVAVMAALLLAGGCSQAPTAGKGEVIKFALAGPLPILEELGFQKGMDLALSEINEEGIVDGKTIVVDQFDDKEDLTEGMKVAQRIAGAGEYSAVIGHFSSNIALATKNVYNDSQTVVMTPMISNVKLTDPPLPYLFRNIASDEAEVEKILTYAKEQGYQDLAVYYRNNDYGYQLSAIVDRRAADFGLSVVDSHTDFINVQEFQQQYEKWKALGVDAVFIGDSMPEAEEFVLLLRNSDPGMPILGAGGFAFADVLADLGAKAAENITYVDPYHYNESDPDFARFRDAYKSVYGEEPGSLALSGYDTIMLLADAIEKGQSAEPANIAKTLKEQGPWTSTFQEMQFDQSGNATGIRLDLAEIRNGSIRIME